MLKILSLLAIIIMFGSLIIMFVSKKNKQIYHIAVFTYGITIIFSIIGAVIFLLQNYLS